MKPLPNQLDEVPGNCGVAINRARDIYRYVDQTIACLEAAMNEKNGSYLRGGFLHQGDYYLDCIIRFAQCAKEELRIAYCPDPSDQE